MILSFPCPPTRCFFFGLVAGIFLPFFRRLLGLLWLLYLSASVSGPLGRSFLRLIRPQRPCLDLLYVLRVLSFFSFRWFPLSLPLAFPRLLHLRLGRWTGNRLFLLLG